jgi:hypothetical protein
MSQLPHLEGRFPNLASLGYVCTSEQDAGYNCIAWAAGDTSRNWDCTRQGGYWPPGADPGETLGHLIGVFQLQGYAVCENGNLEPGFEKVALYADQDGEWQHVARQLPNGQWTSKIGELEDIAHSEIDAVASDDYGRVACYMRRQILQGPE